MAGSFAATAASISLAGFLVALLLTFVVRAAARKLGAVAMPKSDRWHRQPTAMFGGIAVYITVIATVLVALPHTREIWIVLATSSALFAVGMIDDLVHIKPYQKLIGQLIGAGAAIYFGLVLPWTAWSAVNMLITFFWLVGITNAVNMLDNMDGLAAGVSAIASVFLAITFVTNGQLTEALTLCAFAGALLGFLLWNRNPASIFMGDCGSLFIGFFLASSALLSASGGGGRSRSIVAVLAVPVFVLCVPIFDTTFVTVVRKLAGRAASQGGRDHTSHRLVALGLTERRAVWMLYALAIASGSLALLARHAPLDLSVVAIASFVIILTFVGIHLARVHVYAEEEVAAAREKPLVSFLIDLSHRRRIFEVALDVVLISLAYYLAYVLKFGPMNDSGDWHLFATTLPIVICVKLAAFLVTGVYRLIWRYTSVADVVDWFRSVMVGSIATVLVMVLAFRFDGFSRTVFVLDGVLLLILLTGSRFAFRFLRRITPVPHARTGRRVLIFGAGDAGELMLRELNNNAALQYVPVAFVDDDADKIGRALHGLRVYSGAQPLSDICRATKAQEVFLSTAKVPLSRIRTIIAECESCGIPLKTMRMDIHRIADEELGWVLPTLDSAEAETTLASLNLTTPHLTPIVHGRQPHAEH